MSQRQTKLGFNSKVMLDPLKVDSRSVLHVINTETNFSAESNLNGNSL